ncbi:hypothetical protein [Nocardioides daphniae]|uniref:Uncharacterized protein n=1 Tax=Nocardioides daphniae TaxID=402297 RepID=A0A4V1CW80_9ACTN|nr:hypothetical protein [Nocardioides daphniae]QCC76337.1 hypothetical protein E2C04_02345 [Nocardioides daphniae]GGD07788.1 hypothetical protein GCM10007231_03160 [Nocardioides daphniae]
MLGEFTEVARRRPVDLVAPRSATPLPPGVLRALPRPAPYAAVRAAVAPHVAAQARVDLVLASGSDRFTAWWDPVTGAVGLEVTTGEQTSTHVSRRRGRLPHRPHALALTLTGTHLTLFSGTDGTWEAHARYDVVGRCDVRDAGWLSALEAGAPGTDGVLRDVVAGGFGQLGLRDVRWVTETDGTPVLLDGHLVLSATSAGPGFFDTAHTSLWRLHPDTLELVHLSDLFFSRRDAAGRVGAYGDHATHVVRDGGRWLVATSTWGDFDRATRPVRVVLAETDADLLNGEHLLPARDLALPTDGFRSVGVWDPHLRRDATGWRVGYVSARKYFVFHPVLAAGPSLDALEVTAYDAARRATEGTTWLEVDGQLRVLASDGRDGRAGARERFVVLDEQLREVGTLDAPYPSNLPWPTVVPTADGWLMATFDGTPTGGDILGYGTHGDLVLMRSSGEAGAH